MAEKVTACQRRAGRPKGVTDRRDVASLLLAFPDLKCDPGPVGDRLRANGVEPAVLAAWQELVNSQILPESDEDQGY